MSVSLPITDLIISRNWAECVFGPTFPKEFSRTAGGRRIGKLMGEPMWRCEFTSVPMPEAEAGELLALLSMLDERNGTFRAHDARRPRPATTTSGGLSANIMTIGSDNRSLRLNNAPSGLALTVGDYLGFPLAGGGRGLHRVMEAVTVASSGTTDAFEVSPALRPGTETGAGVVLIHAYALFNVESYRASRVTPMHQSVSFVGVEAFV